MEERIVKKLMTSVRCSNCGKNYEMRNVKIIGNQQDLWFLQVSCSACHNRYLIAAVITQDKCPQIISDLTEAEFPKFKNELALSVDDVLDMHDFLVHFDGDFSKLFGSKKV